MRMPRTSGQESAAGEVVPAGGANGSAATEGNGAGPEHAAPQAAPARLPRPPPPPRPRPTRPARPAR